MNESTYWTVSTLDLSLVNYSEVAQTSIETTRELYPGLSVIKYQGAMPPSVAALESKEGPYTHEQMQAEFAAMRDAKVYSGSDPVVDSEGGQIYGAYHATN